MKRIVHVEAQILGVQVGDVLTVGIHGYKVEVNEARFRMEVRRLRALSLRETDSTKQ